MIRPASIRPATPDDAAMIARIHVTAWGETYGGLLLPEDILAQTEPARRAFWARALREGASRVAVAPDAGFASMGPQRDADLAARWPEEVYAVYVLRAAHGRGLGRALLRAVWGREAATALVVEGNPACAFYEAVGARHVDTRDETIGASPVRERVYAWEAGAGP